VKNLIRTPKCAIAGRVTTVTHRPSVRSDARVTRHGLLAASLLFAVGSAASANIVTFDSSASPTGTFYSPATGAFPGGVIFTEDGIQVSLLNFTLFGGGFSAFVEASIDAPGFHPFATNAMRYNNIQGRFDLTALPYSPRKVTIDFVNFGGGINLGVNGTYLELNDITLAPPTIAGVNVSVTGGALNTPGRVTFTSTSRIRSVQIGGQELWIENVNAPPPPGCPIVKNAVTHDTPATPGGTGYPGTFYPPGSFLFTEDGIDVGMDTFTFLGGGSFYNFAYIESTPANPFPTNSMGLNNVRLIYDFSRLPALPTEVRFDYRDLGGSENLGVNGVHIPLSNINLAPAIINGVNVAVTGGVGSALGTVRFTSPTGIKSIEVGGQELFIDNIRVPGTCPPSPAPASQWDFDTPADPVRASFGSGVLSFWDRPVVGTPGKAQSRSAIGTTTDFGIPDINGQVATVLQIPAFSGDEGLTVNPNVTSNSDGRFVNQYSLVFDIFIKPEDTISGWFPLHNTNCCNDDDADLFLDLVDKSFGIGDTGATPAGSFTPGQWQRLAAVYDLSSITGPNVSYYIDGVPLLDFRRPGLLDQRLSLYSLTDADPNDTFHLFTEPTGFFTSPAYINSVYFVDRALTPAEVGCLGSARASGIGNPIVPCPTTCPCSADFDASGGTPDAGDIDAFFAAWLAGDATADADCSGGTPDAGDIDVFFEQWLAGGC
jgi:hypothetical protein